MAYYKDQTAYQLNVNGTPKRIVSLVPSQTELLHDFGLEAVVVGITKFCIHPNDWFQRKERVGGTKNLQIDKIRLLQPDLIIGNKEENTKEQIELLRKEFPVWLSDVNDLDGAIEMIDQLGVITNRIPQAQQIIHGIFEALGQIEHNGKRVLYLIWHAEMMAVGQKTFINSMLIEAGLDNVVREKERYPVLNIQDVNDLDPDFIFLSSEPFPFKEKHQIEYQEKFPNAKVVLVNGELFSWYGSRLLKSFDYFRELNASLEKL